MGLFLLGSTPAVNSDMLAALLGAVAFLGMFFAVNLVRNEKAKIAAKRMTMCGVAAVFILLGIGLFVGGLVWLNHPEARVLGTPALKIGEISGPPEIAVSESIRLGCYSIGMLTGWGVGLVILGIVTLAAGFNWDFES